MSIARLRGKDYEDADDATRIEDYLTSDVAAAWRYLPVELGIGPVLDAAMDERGGSFAAWASDVGVDLAGTTCRLRFWRKLTDHKEPDLVATFIDATGVCRLGVLIEAKLHSPQHRIDGISQLGHYAGQHIRWAWRDEVLADEAPPIGRRVIVYLTKAASCPTTQLATTRQEAGQTLGQDGETLPLFWLGWRTVAAVAAETWAANRADVASRPWLRLLLEQVLHLGARDLLPRDRFTRVELPLDDLPSPPVGPSIPLPGHLPAPPYPFSILDLPRELAPPPLPDRSLE